MPWFWILAGGVGLYAYTKAKAAPAAAKPLSAQDQALYDQMMAAGHTTSTQSSPAAAPLSEADQAVYNDMMSAGK